MILKCDKKEAGSILIVIMSASLSRRTGICAECEIESSSTYTLKIHFQRYHPGKVCRAKGQSFLSFSATTKRKRDDDILPSPDPVAPESKEKQDPVDDKTDAKSEEIPSTSSSTVQGNYTLPQGDPNSLLEEIQHILEKWELRSTSSNTNIETKCEQGAEMKEKDTYYELELENRIKVCVCLKDIENLLTSSFSVDRIDEVLICNACIVNPENILLHDQNHTVPGLFGLQGVEHEKEKVQSRQLHHLKEHISHLKSQKHQAETPSRNTKQKHQAETPSRNTKQKHQAETPSRNNKQKHQAETPSRNTKQKHQAETPSRNTKQKHQAETPSRNTKQKHQAETPSRNTKQKHQAETPSRNTNRRNTKQTLKIRNKKQALLHRRPTKIEKLVVGLGL